MNGFRCFCFSMLAIVRYIFIIFLNHVESEYSCGFNITGEFLRVPTLWFTTFELLTVKHAGRDNLFCQNLYELKGQLVVELLSVSFCKT